MARNASQEPEVQAAVPSSARWVRAPALGRWLLVAELVLALGFVLAVTLGAVVPAWLLPSMLCLIVATVAIGVLRAESGVFARPVIGFRTNEPWVALTFDDGPHPQSTLAVLAILRPTPHRATFFVIGDRVAAHPEVARQMVAEGHGLANHSLRHVPYTPVLPARVLTQELRIASERIAALVGYASPWFRAPVGLISPPVALAAERAGLRAVHWTATARDGVQGANPERCLRRLVPHLRSGAILVLHDGVVGPEGSVAVQVLPELLRLLDARGLRAVTLSDIADRVEPAV